MSLVSQEQAADGQDPAAARNRGFLAQGLGAVLRWKPLRAELVVRGQKPSWFLAQLLNSS